jgi:hypothetical protein
LDVGIEHLHRCRLDRHPRGWPREPDRERHHARLGHLVLPVLYDHRTACAHPLQQTRVHGDEFRCAFIFARGPITTGGEPREIHQRQLLDREHVVGISMPRSAGAIASETPVTYATVSVRGTVTGTACR